MSHPLPRKLGKTDAVRQLAVAHGRPDVNPWASSVDKILEEIYLAVGPASNPQVSFVRGTASGGTERLLYEAQSRKLEAPRHLTARPDCFPPAGGDIAFSPPLKTLSLRDGVFWNFAQSPLVFTADVQNLVVDYSSRYSRLLSFYDVDAKDALRDGVEIDGTAIVLADDIRPLNFCHWLVDWLPRLVSLGPEARHSDCYVLSIPLTAPFQAESLMMCGFDQSRIVELQNFQAVRARKLLVTNDLPQMPHPAFKAAPWAISYLHSTVGFRSALAERGASQSLPRKIYVSRSDAAGRRIANEEALTGLLAKAGYTTVVLSKLSFAAQVTLFAGATHVVGLHGAGLSHVVFVAERATVIEIFPATYGTPAFYVLTAGLGNTYASYVAPSTIANSRAQLDDITIDVVDFGEVCADLL